MINVKISDIVLLLFPIILGIGLVSIIVRKETICGKKSSLQPPGWVFATVWPILYLLMGVSIVLYWRQIERRPSYKLYLFIVATFLLQAWWIIFNKICAPKAAFITLVALAILFLIIALSFYKTSKIATYCMIPLIAWLSFASYLTYSTI
jgi:benzodiazapine receptor